MRVLFRESFLKDIEAIGDSASKKRVRKTIEMVEQAITLKDIGNLRKLKGGESYYRIRIGDYRLGLAMEENTIVFVRCLRRKDIDRYFP